MTSRILVLFLFVCSCSRSLATSPAAPVEAAPPSALEPPSPVVASASSSAGDPPGAPAAGAPAPATEKGGHDHGHAHGKPGYHMDFSAVERFARRFDGAERDAWQKPAEVVRFLELAPGHTIADIGAGTGYFLPHLSKAVGPSGRVLALDVEPNMVEYAKRRSARGALGNVEARLADPSDPGLGPASVDRILVVNTWHHIDDRASYAGKLARALRPEGAILIVDFTLDSDQGPPKEHRLTAEQVAGELESGGLRAEVLRGETLPKQYLVRGSLAKAGSR
jgi:ubiquinone/menaquinone biosynthesis C-methylase UbiE